MNGAKSKHTSCQQCIWGAQGFKGPQGRVKWFPDNHQTDYTGIQAWLFYDNFVLIVSCSQTRKMIKTNYTMDQLEDLVSWSFWSYMLKCKADAHKYTMLYIPRWHLAFVAFVAQALDANGDGRTHPLGNPQHPRRLFAETHLCSRLRVRTGQVVKINLAGQEFGENELRTTPQTFFQIFQQFFNLLLSDPVIFCHIRPNFKTQCGAESKFWKLRTLFISI